jgi:hypothetical protein
LTIVLKDATKEELRKAVVFLEANGFSLNREDYEIDNNYLSSRSTSRLDINTTITMIGNGLEL